MLLFNYLLFAVVLVIVCGIFTYTLYNKNFTTVTNINTKLKNNSIIGIIVVITLSVFINTFYNDIFIDLFTIIYCDTEFINEASFIDLMTLEDEQNLVQVLNHYDVIDLTTCFEMMCHRSGILEVTQVNGVTVNAIKINNVLYTVHPDVVRTIIDINWEVFDDPNH